MIKQSKFIGENIICKLDFQKQNVIKRVLNKLSIDSISLLKKEEDEREIKWSLVTEHKKLSQPHEHRHRYKKSISEIAVLSHTTNITISTARVATAHIHA